VKNFLNIFLQIIYRSAVTRPARPPPPPTPPPVTASDRRLLHLLPIDSVPGCIITDYQLGDGNWRRSWTWTKEMSLLCVGGKRTRVWHSTSSTRWCVSSLNILSLRFCVWGGGLPITRLLQHFKNNRFAYGCFFYCLICFDIKWQINANPKNKATTAYLYSMWLFFYLPWNTSLLHV